MFLGLPISEFGAFRASRFQFSTNSTFPLIPGSSQVPPISIPILFVGKSCLDLSLLDDNEQNRALPRSNLGL